MKLKTTEFEDLATGNSVSAAGIVEGTCKLYGRFEAGTDNYAILPGTSLNLSSTEDSGAIVYAHAIHTFSNTACLCQAGSYAQPGGGRIMTWYQNKTEKVTGVGRRTSDGAGNDDFRSSLAVCGYLA